MNKKQSTADLIELAREIRREFSNLHALMGDVLARAAVDGYDGI